MKLDFATGKLLAVARQQRADRSREYRLLCIVLLVTSLPYLILLWFYPAITVYLVVCMAIFKAAAAFLTSTHTQLSHHIRFLLAGSNPFAMTGTASVLLGGVDAMADWGEDSKIRRQQPWKFWATTGVRVVTTPLGIVLIAMELTWDLLFLRRGWKLVRAKRDEFFSLAYFHDLVCPEKSNDIFYADLAIARARGDVYLYQWQRLRAFVFELQHYKLDIEAGIGVPTSNLFRQSEIAAYQTLKRLQLEEIEAEIASHYATQLTEFPLPPKIARSLIRAASPVARYIMMRSELLRNDDASYTVDECDAELYRLLYERKTPHEKSSGAHKYITWHVLRLLDSGDEVLTPAISPHIDQKVFTTMTEYGIVEPQVATIPQRNQHDPQLESHASESVAYRWNDDFRRDFQHYIQRSFREPQDKCELERSELSAVPLVLQCFGRKLLPRSPPRLEP